MKIRNGFVSNSSSSSFILKGQRREISKEELIKILNENFTEKVLVVGSAMSEGEDVFYLSNRRKAFILANPDRFLANANIEKIYVGDFSFFREPYDLFSDTENILEDDEERIWVDYRCDSIFDDGEDTESFKEFVANYFLTSEEYANYDPWTDEIGDKFFIAYKERMYYPEVGCFIGVNEFGAEHELNGIGFSYKKLTEEDIKALNSVPSIFNNFAKYMQFYKDLKVFNSGDEIELNGKYTIKYLQGIFSESKNIRNFMERA